MMWDWGWPRPHGRAVRIGQDGLGRPHILLQGTQGGVEGGRIVDAAGGRKAARVVVVDVVTQIGGRSVALPAGGGVGQDGGSEAECAAAAVVGIVDGPAVRVGPVDREGRAGDGGRAVARSVPIVVAVVDGSPVNARGCCWRMLSRSR